MWASFTNRRPAADPSAGDRVPAFARSGEHCTGLVLATTPANTPLKTFDPYLGDYAMLLRGKDFVASSR